MEKIEPIIFSDWDSSKGSPVITFRESPESFPNLPALAARLGVEPDSGEAGGFWLMMKDGSKYDLFKLINAFLDRLDSAKV